MDWHAAIKPAKEGVSIDVELVPGSKESRFPTGFDEWRTRIEAKVRAPPEDGLANAELCRLAAAALKVPPANVHVSSGHTSRKKTLTATGLTLDQALERLAGRFG